MTQRKRGRRMQQNQAGKTPNCRDDWKRQDIEQQLQFVQEEGHGTPGMLPKIKVVEGPSM